MGNRGIGRRAVGSLGVAALALTGVLATPAAAAQEPPPWYTPPAAGTYYAGYHISTPSPPLFSRQLGTFGPVTLTLDTNAPFDAFQWEIRDPDPTIPGDELFAWPATWSGGGIEMTRADPFEACLQGATTCQYYVTAGNTANFFFFSGTPPETCTPGGPGTPPDPSVPTSTSPPTCTPDFVPESFNDGPLTLAPFPIPQINLGAVNAVGIAGTGGAAGKIKLTAPGTADEDPASTLTYQWVLVHESGTTYTGSGDTFEPTVDADGNYCVALTVTASSDGYSKSTPSCAPGGGGSVFQITGVAPAPAAPPAPAPVPDSGGIGGGTGGGGGGIPGIGFSNLAQRVPSVLTGGAGASPNVIWLWRPEWFTPANEKSEAPRTDGQPEVRGRRVIIVRSPTPHGASAGPWLAAVGIFGLFGGGWIFSRRRRLRMLAEL